MIVEAVVFPECPPLLDSDKDSLENPVDQKEKERGKDKDKERKKYKKKHIRNKISGKSEQADQRVIVGKIN